MLTGAKPPCIDQQGGNQHEPGVGHANGDGDGDGDGVQLETAIARVRAVKLVMEAQRVANDGRDDFLGAPSAAPSSYLIQPYAPCIQRRGCVPRGMPMYLRLRLVLPTIFTTLLALQHLSASLVPCGAVLRELELELELDLPIRNFSATRKSSHPRALQLAATALLLQP